MLILNDDMKIPAFKQAWFRNEHGKSVGKISLIEWSPEPARQAGIVTRNSIRRFLCLLLGAQNWMMKTNENQFRG